MARRTNVDTAFFGLKLEGRRRKRKRKRRKGKNVPLMTRASCSNPKLRSEEIGWVGGAFPGPRSTAIAKKKTQNLHQRLIFSNVPIDWSDMSLNLSLN